MQKSSRIVKVMCQLKLIKKTKPEGITLVFLLSASYVLRAVLSINLLLCLLLSCSSYGFYGSFIGEHFNTLCLFNPLTSSAVSIEVYTNMHKCIEAGERGFQVEMEGFRLSFSCGLGLADSGDWWMSSSRQGNKYVNAGCSLIHRGAKAVSR